MNIEDLERANKLHHDLEIKEANYNEMLEWKAEHEERQKYLSFSKVDSGFISIPFDRKQAVIDLVHDIVLKEYKDAEKRFRAFQPQHRDKL